MESLPSSRDESSLDHDAERALGELRRLVQGLRITSHSVERACGLTSAQLFVLRQISREPGASIRRLSERTLTDASWVSVVVARLVAAGLVKRTEDPRDRRKSALTLSRKGAQLLARAPEPYQERLIAVMRRLPRSQLRGLRDALVQLSDSLGLESASPFLFEEAGFRRETARRTR